MSCCITRTNGAPGASAAVAVSEWTERYLGDFATAPVVNLAAAAPPNPTVTVDNDTETSDQVADCVWTSNAGDAVTTVTQGTVTTFDTDGATGLRMVGGAIRTDFDESGQNAPHVFCLWNDVLGEVPRGGVDYCMMVRFASRSLSVSGQASGTALYTVNDGTSPTGFVSNPAPDDESRIAGWLEVITGFVGVTIREDAPIFQQNLASAVGVDTVGIIVHAGSGNITAIMGISVAGVLPEPNQMVTTPGSWIGSSNTFSPRPYLDSAVRLAIPFQQIVSNPYSATIDTVRVLSRG